MTRTESARRPDCQCFRNRFEVAVGTRGRGTRGHGWRQVHDGSERGVRNAGSEPLRGGAFAGRRSSLDPAAFADSVENFGKRYSAAAPMHTPAFSRSLRQARRTLPGLKARPSRKREGAVRGVAERVLSPSSDPKLDPVPRRGTDECSRDARLAKYPEVTLDSPSIHRQVGGDSHPRNPKRPEDRGPPILLR